MKKQLRKSQYGDYFAVDYCKTDFLGNLKIIETPLYLRKGEQAEIKMRWDCTGEFDINHSWMEPALIRFDGSKVEVAYKIPSLGQKEIRWWEPEDKDLKHPAFIHYKI